MRISRLPTLAAGLATVLLITSCAGSDADLDANVADAPVEATDESDAPADPEPGSATEATLQALADLEPEVAANAHDHDEQDGHDEMNELAESMRLQGVDPERIVIPAIDVDADVIDLGIEPNGDMEVPSDFAQTGWFRNGPKPGRVGPAIIAGHIDDSSGPAVFFRLSQLSPGDEIEVHGEDGTMAVFAVTGQEQFPKDELPRDLVFGGTDSAELRLITCGGNFDQDARSYEDNTIVFAERIDHL